MLNKALIGTVLMFVALLINGTDPTAAGSLEIQETRPVPSEARGIITTAVPVSGETGDELREEFHQTYPLSATGRVSLENINGGVQIKVWDRAAVQVDATKKAYRKERLAEAKIEVNSSDENIRIKTDYPDWNQTFRSDDRRYDNPAVVEYVLTIPRKASLESIELVNGSLDIDGAEGSVKASSINGGVKARGLLGETKLSTINGSLEASFTQLNESVSVDLGSVNGDVSIVIPSNANASIRAGTVHGGISNDFGLPVKHGEYVGHNLEGQIGNGATKIKLGNVNGRIKISHAADGLALSPVTSIQLEKEKIKDEAKEALSADINRQIEQANQIASEEAARAVDSARIAREAQRQVDEALREAQREIQQAQREIQREQRDRLRESIRLEANRGRGVGAGVGAGVGTGRSSNKVSSQESKSFSVTGTPRVNVVTFDGPITVHGWDKSEVSYTVTKRADDDEDLKMITVDGQQQGSTVSIIAKCDDDRTGSTQIEVFVPRNSSLHVSSGDGELKLDKVSGDITLRTGDGSIDVSEAGGQLQVNTGDGHIQVARFDGQVDARTGDGAIDLDGTFSSVAARTGDGSITLSVPSGSNFTIETNVDSEVTPEGLNISEAIAPTPRIKRWSVGSGGKVFTLKTGDGRILLRSR
ncbi:MAG TPA: DUF4097 family beta strand repeat-containing protein [Pyrinomonadaceae bacterium]|nr:DUF4097 family beta strand repeat-containing protein [Pyrinomonadaceae bacterium]